jgi:FG-GAP-like repeat
MGANAYFLQVSNGTTIVFQGGYPAAQVCSGTACSFSQPTALAQGTHFWAVRADNASGGTWSPEKSFTVQGPPAPTALSPTGPGTTVVPTFMWSAVAGEATHYVLSVDDDRDTTPSPLFEIWYTPAEASCAGTTCSVNPNRPLRVGGYTWAVRARNATGPGGWSNVLPFTVEPPAPPILLAPKGTLPTQTPTFSWRGSPGAMDYTLSVLKPNGQALYEQVVGSESCNAETCSVTPGHALEVGVVYHWRVRGQHLGGFGDWSSALAIRVASMEDCDLEFVVADFNGDGIPDGLCQTEGDVYVGLGTGSGSLGIARVWIVHTFARLLAGDFDGDGKTDLLDVDLATGDFLVARSTGSTFVPLTSWGIARATSRGTTYTCQGEELIAGTLAFDSDARTDVFCRDGNLKFFLGRSTGTAFAFSILDDPPPALNPAQEYIYAGPRPLAIVAPEEGVPQ